MQPLARAGYTVGREQARRLMKLANVRGVNRAAKKLTTRTDPDQVKPKDLVNRKFLADQPNRLWVVDKTYVRTWARFAYTAFVTDVCTRQIRGWNVASSMKTGTLPLPAFEHAVWDAGTDLSGLIHHSDHGSNYLSISYTDRLVE